LRFCTVAFAFRFASVTRRTFMKITVNTRKPRNPIVAHAQFRRAGSHQPGGRSQRQQAGRSLKRELEQMKQHSP